MTKRIDGEFDGLLDAQGVCPVCKNVHNFRLNPGYPPTVWTQRIGKRNAPKAYRDCTWRERAQYFFFRVICDRCLSHRATKAMRAKLAEKGWDVK